MLNTNDKIIKHKVGLLNLAEELGNERTHQGQMCCGRTPMATLGDGKTVCQKKSLN